MGIAVRLVLLSLSLLVSGVFVGSGFSAVDGPLLSKSTNGKAKGTILLVHGSAPFNQNGRVPWKTESVYSRVEFFRLLASKLNQDGWDTVRYSKPGVALETIDFDTYKKTDFAMLLGQLKRIWATMPSDKPRIIFAWSEGSLLATHLPLADMDALIILGGISTNIKEAILAQASSLPQRQQIETQLRGLAGKKREEMLGIERPAGRLIDELALPDNWTLLKEYPRLPVFVLHGEADKEVPLSQARIWKEKLPKNPIVVQIRKNGNHMYGQQDNDGSLELGRTINDWLDTSVLKR